MATNVAVSLCSGIAANGTLPAVNVSRLIGPVQFSAQMGGTGASATLTLYASVDETTAITGAPIGTLSPTSTTPDGVSAIGGYVWVIPVVSNFVAGTSGTLAADVSGNSW